MLGTKSEIGRSNLVPTWSKFRNYETLYINVSLSSIFDHYIYNATFDIHHSFLSPMPTQIIWHQLKCIPWPASPMFLKNLGTPPKEPLSLSGMQGFFLAHPGLLLNGRLYQILVVSKPTHQTSLLMNYVMSARSLAYFSSDG